MFAALTTHFDQSFVLSNKGRVMTGAVILMGVMQGMGDVPCGRSKRGAMSVARFKIVGELVWDRVSGRSDGVWDNQA